MRYAPCCRDGPITIKGTLEVGDESVIVAGGAHGNGHISIDKLRTQDLQASAFIMIKCLVQTALNLLSFDSADNHSREWSSCGWSLGGPDSGC
jgi:hypothetical protein